MPNMPQELINYAGCDGLDEHIMYHLIIEALIHMPRSWYSPKFNLESSDDKTWQNAVVSDPRYMNLENLHNSPQV